MAINSIFLYAVKNDHHNVKIFSNRVHARRAALPFGHVPYPPFSFPFSLGAREPDFRSFLADICLCGLFADRAASDMCASVMKRPVRYLFRGRMHTLYWSIYTSYIYQPCGWLMVSFICQILSSSRPPPFPLTEILIYFMEFTELS